VALRLRTNDAGISGELQQTQELQQLSAKLADVLAGKSRPADAAEAIRLAHFGHKFQRYHVGAAKLFQNAFALKPALAEDLKAEHRYRAACAALLAANGYGKGASALTQQERADWRKQALTWLQADLQKWREQSASNQAGDVLGLLHRLADWQSNPELVGVRDAKELAKLSPEEQQNWQKLWSERQSIIKQAMQRFHALAEHKRALTGEKPEQFHKLKLRAGAVYVLDLMSGEFDAYLKLYDPDGRILAEDDDGGGDLNARLVFTLPRDGVYRALATSYQRQGIGAYTLMLREFYPKKK